MVVGPSGLPRAERFLGTQAFPLKVRRPRGPAGHLAAGAQG